MVGRKLFDHLNFIFIYSFYIENGLCVPKLVTLWLIFFEVLNAIFLCLLDP